MANFQGFMGDTTNKCLGDINMDWARIRRHMANFQGFMGDTTNSCLGINDTLGRNISNSGYPNVEMN